MHVKIDGLYITIDSFFMTKTYAGMLEGLPTREGNERLIAEANLFVKTLWGDRCRTLVVTPKVTPIGLDVVGPDTLARYKNAERLPDFQCYAWLSSGPLDEDFDGSHVFLVWWDEKNTAEFSTPERVRRAMQGVKWTAVAEGWNA